MDNLESVGCILKREREGRGLSLQAVQDATKITVQNLAALEEDRFDYFPNRVYTRAFLRDYANYLGLDSGSLLTQYEDVFSIRQEPVVVPPTKSGSALKIIVSLLIVLVILGGLAFAGYLYYSGQSKGLAKKPAARPVSKHDSDSGIATMPTMPNVPAPKPAPVKPVATAPTPPPAPVKPDVMTLEMKVTGKTGSWIKVKADGKIVDMTTLPYGAVKTYKAKQLIRIRSGNCAVKLKWNGVNQPPIGPVGVPGDKDYKFADAPVPPASVTPAENAGSNGGKPALGIPVKPTPVKPPAPPVSNTAPAPGH